MEFKGTKGEWNISSHIEYTGEYSLVTEKGSATFKEDKHNAKLIAAAPELLEALQGALKRLNDLRESGRISLNIQETFRDMEIAEKAINKSLK